MQAVPSIVGTSSVVAAAAVGLVFAQPSQTTQSRSSSPRRKLGSDLDSFRDLPVTLSRPATSIAGSATPATHTHSEPSRLALSPTSGNATRPSRSKPPSTHSTQLTPPKVTSRRHSFARQREGLSPSISEDVRDSVSSNGSWMRRLSMRPLSQHGSIRSSVGPDSSSVNYSHASSLSVLPPIPSTPPRQLPPNKLVKRSTPAGQPTPSGKLSRRGSRSQIPSLRRPATSHQRSATLQQVQYQGSPQIALSPAQPKYSLDQQSRPTTTQRARPQLDIPEEGLEKRRSWSSFFHLRVVRSSSRSSSGRGGEGSEGSFPGSPGPGQLPTRTLDARKGSAGMPRAYLVNASVMSGIDSDAGCPGGAASTRSPWVAPPAAPPATAAAAGGLEQRQHQDAETTLGDCPTAEPDKAEQDAASKRARRSISMHFSSPTAWISRNGSIRRQKRGADGKSGGLRNVSAPAVGAALPIEAQAGVKQDLQHLFAPPTLDKRQASSTMDVSPAHPPAACRTINTSVNTTATRQRNSSSPLPPLSRLSSFHVDLYRAGSSASSAAVPRRHDYQLQASPFPASTPGGPIPCHSRDVSNERAPTLAGSDLDMRSFVSGDDDDTDFKSDTMYESIRTGGSVRVRNVDTPLESMFDESPPSTAGNTKAKRLSIQEMLGRTWDPDSKIMEEDENAATPVRHPGVSQRAPVDFHPTIVDVSGRREYEYENSAPPLSLATRDFGRLSLDEDDDFDWARDDENALSNHLSPPSSSINSGGASPSLRLALASISGNGSPRSATNDSTSERPRSTVFDWTEPICQERVDVDGPSPRPKTVNGKPEAEGRNGRVANRKGPTATHVRSQSVPTVPDPPETVVKSNPAKFRTWASGPKNVSEDWEEDFEFDEEPVALVEGNAVGSRFSMIVPASIQATQPTVKAHSGQIRELSLLVNGLKRLCRHGRDLNLLNESAELWQEAEDIIRLASPDEDEGTGRGDSESVDFDLPVVNERYTDEGFDAASLNYSEESFDVPEPGMSRMAVVRERQVARRRSVFPPEDDIFGSWPSPEDHPNPATPQTPNRTRQTDTPDSAVIASVIEAMQQQHQQQQRRSSSAPVKGFPPKTHSDSKLFFDTNSLQELVKQANVLFHVLSDIVRKAEFITQSPAITPKRERHLRRDGSPAFTRVFTDPTTAPPSPPKRLLKSSHSNSSVISGRPSAESRTSTSGLGPRLHMMTVS
ncbi:hypothetical protein RB601_009309 [Gaeumannomyces tritici]